MPRLVLVTAVFVALLPLPSEAKTSFYSLDISSVPKKLVKFDSASGSSSIAVATVPSVVSNPAAVMDLSGNGRFFIAPTDTTNTVYEVDPNSGTVLGSIFVGGSGSEHINGLAVSNAGLIYVSQESPGTGNRFWRVDFDQGQSTNFVTIGYDIDDIDFDDEGNLIGNDINETGKVYEIPLDGSLPSLIATLPGSDSPFMTFSSSDSAFYFKETYVSDNGRGLYRLPWSSGQPAGPLEYVKDIGIGTYVGIAAIPEPSTVLLLSTAFLLVLRRRQAR